MFRPRPTSPCGDPLNPLSPFSAGAVEFHLGVDLAVVRCSLNALSSRPVSALEITILTVAGLHGFLGYRIYLAFLALVGFFVGSFFVGPAILTFLFHFFASRSDSPGGFAIAVAHWPQWVMFGAFFFCVLCGICLARLMHTIKRIIIFLSGFMAGAALSWFVVFTGRLRLLVEGAEEVTGSRTIDQALEVVPDLFMQIAGTFSGGPELWIAVASGVLAVIFHKFSIVVSTSFTAAVLILPTAASRLPQPAPWLVSAGALAFFILWQYRALGFSAAEFEAVLGEEPED